MNTLVITTMREKENMLKQLGQEQALHHYKFMTKEQFFEHYYYKMKIGAVVYLMNQYNYKYDVAYKYLMNLFVIDCDKKYHSKKLQQLQNIKNDLIQEGLLEYDSTFLQYLKKTNIIVIGYEKLEKYELQVFEKLEAVIKNYEKKNYKKEVVECQTLEEEILFVISEISKLMKQGVSLSDIVLANVDADYYFSLKKIFSYFHIPINVNTRTSIYGTMEVQDYLKTGILRLDNPTDVTKKLVEVLNSLSSFKNDINYQDILIQELKEITLPFKKIENAINIIDLDKEIVRDEQYVFVLGFNLNNLPKTYKDEDFINDNQKEEVELFLTNEKNKYEVDYAYRLLSNIKHLYISYKLKSNFNVYYPSNMIEDYQFEVHKFQFKDYHLSNTYNQLLLGQKLDQYMKYRKKDNELVLLYNHYPEIKYNVYDNQFSGIPIDSFYEFMNYKLSLSYTSLNNYNLCRFRYYVKHILKIDTFVSAFALKLGNIFHEILEYMDESDFDFEKVYQSTLEKYDLSVKEIFFMENIKTQIIQAIKMIRKQRSYSKYQNTLYEQEIIVPLKKANFLDVSFKGKIDKIMYYKHIDDAYFALIDYKTGNVDTSLNNIKYGLSMQLPIYLYLMSHTRVFDTPVFTGFYYQKLLHNKESYKQNLQIEQVTIDHYKLKGYSTDNEELLKDLDCTYKDSEVIKSMKVTDKGFSRFTKLLSDDEVYHLIKYTTALIDQKTDEILNADFRIDPKVIDGENVSCKYCEYKDLCFVKEENKEYLEKVSDLSFLGGDI